MHLKEIQEAVDKYILSFKEGYFPPHCNLARLMEEVGELSREVNHRYSPKKKRKETDQRDRAQEEMGDIIFTLAALANQMELDLEKAIESSLKKCYERDSSRWTPIESETTA